MTSCWRYLQTTELLLTATLADKRLL